MSLSFHGLGFALLTALALAGCSSSSDDLGPTADFAAVQSRLDQPDGTLTAGNVADVHARALDGLRSVAGFDLSGGGGAGGALMTKSAGLHLLDSPSSGSAKVSCNALIAGAQSGTCDCPTAGTIDFALTGGAQSDNKSNTTIKYRLKACANGSTVVDGSESVDIQVDTTDAQNPFVSLLLDIDAMVTSAGATKHVDVQLRYGNDGAEISLKVDDGWVDVSITWADYAATGAFKVKDKSGTWTCKEDKSGQGTCSNGQGEMRSF